MWWKLSFAMLLGVAMGIAGTCLSLYLIHASTSNMEAAYIPIGWSSANKEWPAFAAWLRHGGRKLLTGAAFIAAKNGMTEAEVRATFGPPDFVAVGGDELGAYPVVRMRGMSGAYFYKIGSFAYSSNKFGSGAFTIVFDAAGTVMYRLGFGVNEDDRLADIDTDTRTDRRVLQVAR
jgi:hypothetical protein